MATITKIEKNGPVVTFYTDCPNSAKYKLDFEKCAIYGLSGSPLKSTNSIINKIDESTGENWKVYLSILRVFNSIYCDNNFYKIAESLLSYPDLVTESVDGLMFKALIEGCNKKLPKGYVSWCRKNNRIFSYTSLHDFKIDQIVSQWPNNLVDNLKRIKSGSTIDLMEITGCDKELCITFIKMINNSLKRYEFSDIKNYIKYTVQLLTDHPSLCSYLDDTKSVKVAYEILKNALQEKTKQKNIK